MNAIEASRERWQRLVDAGIVDGPMPAHSDVPAPWYVAALVGVAAWLAALFLMVFLAIAIGDFVKQAAGAIAVGAIVTGIAAFVLRRAGERTFVSQLALAFSLAGQGLVLAGVVFAGGRNVGASAAIFALVEIALVVIVPHAAHRLLATVAAALSLGFAAGWLGLDPLFLPAALAAFVLVQRGVVAASRHEATLRPVAYGIALALLAAWVVTAELRGLLVDAGSRPAERLATVATFALAIVCAAAGAMLARECGAERRTMMAAAFALAVVALAAKAVPAVAVALVILLYAYAGGQHAMFGLGALGLVAALAHHYWRLDTTLLAKAASLAALGVTLAIGCLAVRRWPGRKAHDAA
jgi:hypothetical protein